MLPLDRELRRTFGPPPPVFLSTERRSENVLLRPPSFPFRAIDYLDGRLKDAPSGKGCRWPGPAVVSSQLPFFIADFQSPLNI